MPAGSAFAVLEVEQRLNMLGARRSTSNHLRVGSPSATCHRGGAADACSTAETSTSMTNGSFDASDPARRGAARHPLGSRPSRIQYGGGEHFFPWPYSGGMRLSNSAMTRPPRSVPEPKPHGAGHGPLGPVLPGHPGRRLNHDRLERLNRSRAWVGRGAQAPDGASRRTPVINVPFHRARLSFRGMQPDAVLIRGGPRPDMMGLLRPDPDGRSASHPGTDPA